VGLVIDASVIVKWLLNDPERERDTEVASRLVEAVVEGRETVLQPIHWLVEVGAVLARLSPATAADDLAMLRAHDLATTDDFTVLRRGCELAVELDQHLFDTLYQAVALEAPEGLLVTADERYLRRARSAGRTIGLAEWGDRTRVPSTPP
jgi:predicted nucleic acid-binding protein